MCRCFQLDLMLNYLGEASPREAVVNLLDCNIEVSEFELQSFYFGLIFWEKVWNSLSYLPDPSARAGYDTRSIFKRSLTGLNSEFSFS